MTVATLQKIIPKATAAKINVYAPLLSKFMAQYKIVGLHREAAFLAAIAHESDNLEKTVEDGNDAYFKRYEGNKNLGNTKPGDGLRFKGRGLIQITGRWNYTALSKTANIDFVASPKLLEEPVAAVISACWFWNFKKLSPLADQDEFKEITRLVNGGYNGWANRQALYLHAKNILLNP